MNRCVINVSTDKYKIGQDRLIDSLVNNTDADVLMYQSEQSVGAKPHSQSMYGFKPCAFSKAYDLGYTSILWLDASMNVLKDITPIFELIEKDAYFAQNSGWKNERWSTPEQIEYFGTSNGWMISSGVLGLDLTNPIGSEFLQKWLKASNDGMFNFSHDVSRQDQTCASLIIENMGLNITENNTLWNYGKEAWHDGIVLVADGIV